MQTNKEQATTTPEEKGAKFLQWVADNEKEMRKALRKNCTYDPDIFDDVYSEVIINVYNTIVKNNREIDNIKNYFFLALKWHYQMRQNQHRRKGKETVRDYWDNHTSIDQTEDEIAKDADVNNALVAMREVLTEQYGERWTEIFFTYWDGRSKNATSYQALADKFGITGSIEPLKQQLQKMRAYVVEEMKYIREIFNTDYAND